MGSDRDAAFTLKLLNTPKFIKYIGDRGVRSVAEAEVFIDTRYRKSYQDYGFGLYAVELKSSDKLDLHTRSVNVPIGICGFVRRETLPSPDLGFAFLPEFEGRGYALEAATAMIGYGRERLGFDRVLAITTLDNHASGRLLIKLGFVLDGPAEIAGETLNLYVWTAAPAAQ